MGRTWGLSVKPSMQAFESGLSVQMCMHRHTRGEENIMYSGGILEDPNQLQQYRQPSCEVVCVASFHLVLHISECLQRSLHTLTSAGPLGVSCSEYISKYTSACLRSGLANYHLM